MIARAASLPSMARDILALAKPRVTALVLCTTAGGIWLAPGSMAVPVLLLMLAATALTVGSANTLNCYLEREIDGRMARTRSRPLPAGRLEPRIALYFGLALGLISLPVLAVNVNPLTALLAAVALVSYVLVYTPMKQQSPLALWVGAIPGAIPPLMGWTAVTGTLDAPGVALFGILFVWQIPHFHAIALFRFEDYAGAGFKTFPVVHGERATRRQLAAWATLLLPVSLLPTFLGVTGIPYLVVASILGVGFAGLSWSGLRRDPGRRWALRVFIASILYLALLFATLMLDAR